ncbi:Calx-beta domain-containing protein [Larkinella arboricola]|uniref:Calx-beta domain-containing protein n=1 Tax=Larkinella arboricola TaxID=643671 RepID=A0A327WY05_LARAB|nr:Calx-beta domain-containing protein [Larkinella arboricola]RAJ94415.1 Calx-beta domain-containing protein [Larkinella arboricola]
MKLKGILTSTVLALLIGLAIVACETQDFDRTFEGPYFVRFTDTTLTYKESYSQEIPIRVHNVGPQRNEPITVTYTVSGSAREGKDYSIEGTKGTVTIPANESFGEIRLKLINNANNILESQNLVFTLTGVQSGDLQVGFGKDGIMGKSMTFVIQDDCLLSGTYTGTRRVGNQSATIRDIAITSSDCKTYTVTNWNIGLFSFEAIKASLTFIDNGDNSLTIPVQSNPELAAPRDTISGTGSWNPQNRQISLNVRIKVPVSETKDSVVTFPLTYVPQ